MSDEWAFDPMNGWYNTEDDPATMQEAALLEELREMRANHDPASFRYQRDQAHEAIRELLALLDAEKARADLLAETLRAYQCAECGVMLIPRPVFLVCRRCEAARS